MAYGFKPITHGGYNYQTGGFEEFPINPAEATRISHGDLVKLTNDYGIVVLGATAPIPLVITAGSGGNTVPANQALGVFVGCRYVDTNGTPTWNNMWPGAAGTEAFGFVVTDPNAVYLIHSTDEWAELDLGNLVNPTLTAGATDTGLSGAVVASNNDVGDACLRIVGVHRDGSDITSSDSECDLIVRWSSPTCTLYGYPFTVT
jgi:hypothetical protein